MPSNRSTVVDEIQECLILEFYLTNANILI